MVKSIHCETFEEWAKDLSLDPNSKHTEELYRDWAHWWGRYIMIRTGQDIFKNKTAPDMNAPKNMTVVNQND